MRQVHLNFMHDAYRKRVKIERTLVDLQLSGKAQETV